MGGIVKGLGTSVGSTSNTGTISKSSGQLEAQVAHLTKIVHHLVKELAEVEKFLKVTPDGITLQSGMSQVAILATGVEIKSYKLRLKSATKDETRI